MLCTYCKSARVQNEAPCPNCGAPSPYLQVSQHGGWGTEDAGWGQQNVPQLSFDQNKQTYSGQLAQQQSFPSGQLSWQQDPNPLPPWQQPSGQLPYSNQQEQDHTSNQSYLPVPYQGDTALQEAGRQPTITLQLVPDQAIQHLLPAEPLPQPETVYVPPMYTKPRPIVPRYRVISGLLSVVIMALLVCSGTGYYAKASGYWDKVVSMYTGQPPEGLTQGQKAKIPDPPKEDEKKDRGPAYKYVQVATTAKRVNEMHVPTSPQNVFKPGEDFYLTFTFLNNDKDSKVVTKWYTNKNFYGEFEARNDKGVALIKKGDNLNGSMSMKYNDPAEGSVEIYVNGEFARRLYFAIRAD